jgi:hypothetical protein
MATKTKQKPSHVRMRESGHKLVQLWPTVEEHALLSQAAAADRRPLSQFLLLAGLAAVTKKNRKRSCG